MRPRSIPILVFRFAGIALLLLAAAGLSSFRAPRSLQRNWNRTEVADTNDPEGPLPYPFQAGQSGGMYGTDPTRTEVVYDPLTGQYVVVRKIGDLVVTPPMLMSPEEYQAYVFNQQLQSYWGNKTGSGPGSVKNAEGGEGTEDGRDEISNILPKINVRGEMFNRIFGSNTIEIIPQGSAELTFGLRFQRIRNPNLPIVNQKIFNFNFDQRIQMNVTGKIGEKMQLRVNYDTEASFAFENQMKLEYSGQEDDIIKKIELGNVSLPTQNSLISGAQSLFGVKAQAQFGKLMLTGIFSEQRSQSNSVNIQGGATTTDFEVWGDQYEANRHFFMSQYFRSQFERSLTNAPLITSPIQITRVEVWVTNRRNSTQDIRHITAVMDLGESESGAYRNPGAGLSGPSIFPGPNPSTEPGNPPNNGNNQLNPNTLSQTYPGIRDISQVNALLNGAGYEEATEFVELANARKLQPNEYVLQPQLGYISLNQALNQDEVLSVSFQYTMNGRTYQVGEFSNDGINAPEVLFTKMLKSTILNVKTPIWDLMMKNIYSLNAFQVNREDFKLDVLYMNDETGVPIPFLPRGNLSEQLLIRVMEVDKLNNNNDPVPGGDGFFDFIEGITINSQNGRIIFPVLEPFGSHLGRKLDNQADRDRYVFQELYDSTRFKAQNETQLNKFLLRGRYKSASGSEISLGAFNIPQGSVRVTAGGTPLVENQDFTVDYTLGRVRIINESLLQSGVPIKVDYENNTLFNFQTKTYMGLAADYRFNQNLTLGATLINFNERPLTQKVNLAEEPVSNTLWGLNGTYSKDAPYLTRLVDQIPFIDTKEASDLTVQGEFAHMIPGSPRGIEINGDATTYIDDFESSQTFIDIRNPNAWVLASVPGGQNDLFPEGALNDAIGYNFNRAQTAWYTIDPTFYNNDANTPDNILNDKNLQSGQYVRQVLVEEVYPNRQLDQSAIRNIATLDLAYYPDERGPYNFEVEGGPNSSGLNADGTLADPASRWGGVMRALQTNNFEEQNIEYIQFWLLDPFLEDPNLAGGDLYFNLGSVSEDILKDGRQAFENGLSSVGDLSVVDSTAWGYVPRNQPLVQAFDNDPNSRPLQDVGYDGLSDAQEATWTPGSDINYLQRIAAALGTGTGAYQSASADPSADNFAYYLAPEYDAQGADILQRYKRFNNPQNNSSTAQVNGFPQSATQIPDIEDLNRDQTMSKTESYYQYKIHIDRNDLVVGQNYITDRIVTTVTPPNNQPVEAVWYQFKIPIFEPERKVGPINDFRSIRFVRMFLKGFSDPIVLRFASLDLVRGEWRRYPFSLDGIREDVPVDGGDATLFEVNARNLEENGSRQPIPYVLPPGIDRQILFGTASLQQQNEQSLSLRVCDLRDGDARAVFRNLQMDMRNYQRLRMFVHAEAGDQRPLRNGELTAFIRLGSDYNQNYYEYEIPLTVTPWGEITAEGIWPEANNFDFDFEVLKSVKLERDRVVANNPGQSITTPYSVQRGANRVTVLGAPNLSNVRTILIGLRNPKKRLQGDGDDGLPKCAEVWVNELRLGDFDQRGGWAANARVVAKLADFGQVALAGRTSSIGFGSIEQSVSERQKESIRAYDLQTNFELGKFFGEKARLRVPFFFGVSEEWRDPQFNPLDPDIEFDDALANLETDEERQTLKEIAQDYTLRRGFNFTNVGRQRGGDAKRTPQVYDIENFNASYSFNEQFRRNINTVADRRVDHRAALGYIYQTKPKSVEPFKNKDALKSDWLKLVRDFNFFYYPSKFQFRTEVLRNYQEAQQRNTDNFDFKLPVTYNKAFTMLRQYDLVFDLTKALRFDYTATMNTRIDELYGPASADSVRESIQESFWAGGRPTQYQQRVNLAWKVPIDKIPILSFTSLETRYGGSYSWNSNSQTALNAENDSLRLGNTIQNSATIDVNTQFNLVDLYNKWPYLQTVNNAGQAARNSGPARRPARGTRDRTPQIDSAWVNRSTGRKILDGTARVLMSVRTLSGSWQQTQGTALPGFLPRPEHFGMNPNSQWAPGLGFAFGLQPPDDLSSRDIRVIAAQNDWLTTSPYQNNPYSRTYSEQLNARGSIEPFKDFRIELTALRSESYSTNAFWRFDSDANAFEEQNRNTVGNFSMSYYTLPTAWDASTAPDYSSEAFEQFLQNRIVISEQLARERAANDPTYNPSLVGDPDSTNYGYDGYSVISQEVLIPAFLAAYTGQDAQGYRLGWKRSTPIPNWSLSYDGLMKMKFFAERFNSFTLTHAYRSLYSVRSFQTNLAYGDSILNAPDRAPRNINGDFMPEQLVNQIGLSEQFSPLIGINVRMKNSVTLRFDYKKDRTIDLSLASNQVTEIKGTEYVVGVGYILKDIRFNFIRVGAQRKAVVSNLELKADVGIRDNLSVVRRIIEELDQVNSGQRIVTIKFSADYVISPRLTAKFFYDQNISRYKISTAFPTSSISSGISIRLNLGQ
ncbi:cell surface protein SprA [bacterium]|nr:cell surface protein SprA [bacterium]